MKCGNKNDFVCVGQKMMEAFLAIIWYSKKMVEDVFVITWLGKIYCKDFFFWQSHG
jgi:hypothetical protein